ncbi:hypothetical protein H1O16_gp141 [Burkholderia phage BcepSaruman]|uniref:Uncharacterized protein n=1 Tax=Burkholderia phage BcepSaruman TaxID=2530032 RepID=A0A4D5ZC70_9CAUD|nr:hypothetical protein H1O16_gp141 [Burkholderia phage BcepSaruman]QBX06554.1 hypothetical protein BcepSaruman_141 [Burkholderia phage BcepSaruman]
MAMTLADRIDVVLDLVDHEREADVLNRYVVDKYIERTDAPFNVMPFGADNCPRLGRDLAKARSMGYLTRHATGIGDGFSSMGFPKWVYSYRLTDMGRNRLALARAIWEERENGTCDR